MYKLLKDIKNHILLIYKKINTFSKKLRIISHNIVLYRSRYIPFLTQSRGFSENNIKLYRFVILLNNNYLQNICILAFK